MYRMKVDLMGDEIIVKLQNNRSQLIRFVMPRLTTNRPPQSTDARETLPIHWWWRRGGMYGHTMALRTTKASLLRFCKLSVTTQKNCKLGQYPQ